MATENDDEGSREQWSRWEGAESQVSSHAGAALCSAALCARVQFKQSAECGLFEGHVVSGFIGHAACAPPKNRQYIYFYFQSIPPRCLKSGVQFQSLVAKFCTRSEQQI